MIYVIDDNYIVTANYRIITNIWFNLLSEVRTANLQFLLCNFGIEKHTPLFLKEIVS